MSVLRVNRSDVDIYIAAEDAALLNRIADLLQPYFTTTLAATRSDASWVVCLDSTSLESLGPRGSFEVDVVTPQGEPAREYRIYEESRLIYISEPKDDAWKIQHAARLVRVLVRFAFSEKGMLFLHGGMIRYKGKGIVLLGSKRAGKTSSILTMLHQANAQFVTNDDIGIVLRQEKLFGAGWPRAISVRKDTLELAHFSPVVKKLVRNHLTHPANWTGPDDFYTFFYPSELASLFGAGLTSEAELDCLVFLRFVDDAKDEALAKIDCEQAFDALSSNHEKTFNKHSGVFHKFFRDTSAHNLATLEALARQVPAFSIAQRFSHVARIDSVMDSILDQVGAARRALFAAQRS